MEKPILKIENRLIFYIFGELSQKQQNEVLEIVKTYRNQLVQQWKDFVEGKNIKIIKVK